MKRNRRRLPVPQYEFGFTPDTFNLIIETGVDGDRVACELAEAGLARRMSEAAQAGMFKQKSKKKSVRNSANGRQRTPKRTPKEFRRVTKNPVK